MQFYVDEDALMESERLDRCLALLLEGVSRERIKQLILAGEVTVNNHVCCKVAFALSPGMTLAINLPDASPIALAPEAIPLTVVYEDKHLLVVDKPRGMLTHPAGRFQTGTLVNALLHHCGASLSGINGQIRPGIVHRLDKDTSGLLMVAKTDAAHQGLAAQIQAKTARREYQAIVQGVFNEPSGTVNAPIGRNPKKRDTMAVLPTGRPAVTHWQVLQRLTGGSQRGLTLVQLRLETGRTHQIRVHMAHIGHPVLGDPQYGTGLERQLRLPCAGQLLQAVKLAFTHPISGDALSFEIPLAPEFQAVLALLAEGGGPG